MGAAQERTAICVVVLAIGWAFHGEHLMRLESSFLRYDDYQNYVNKADDRFALSRVATVWSVESSNVVLGVFEPVANIVKIFIANAFGLTRLNVLLASFIMLMTATVQMLWLVRKIEGRAFGFGSIGAIAFLAHPHRIEVLAWASCLPYLVSLCLCLFALDVMLIDRIRGWKKVLLLTVLATLSKPIAFPALLMLLVAVSLGDDEKQKFSKNVAAGVALAACCSLLSLILWAMGHQREGGAVTENTLVGKVLAATPILGYSFIATVVPSCGGCVHYTSWVPHLQLTQPSSMLGPDCRINVGTLASLPTVLGILVVAAFSSAASYSLYFHRSTHAALAILGPILFLIPGIMANHGRSVTLISDRYMLFPHACMVLLLSAAAKRCSVRLGLLMRRSVSLVLMAVCCYCLYRYHHSSCPALSYGKWNNTETLWKSAIDHDDGNYVAMEGLAQTLGQKQATLGEAVGWLKRAVETHPESINAWHNMAVLERRSGNLVGSYNALRRGLALSKADNEMKMMMTYIAGALGDRYYQQKVFDKAMEMYGVALQNDGKNVDHLYQYAACQARLGLLKAAIATLQELLQQSPRDEQALDLKKRLEGHYEKRQGPS